MKMDLEAIASELEIAVKAYPMKHMASELGKRYTTLANELAEQPGWKLGWTDMLRIVALSKHTEILDLIEEAFGRVAFVIPRATANPSPLMLLVGKLTREFSEHMAAVAAAIEDGEVQHKESEKCLKELSDVIAACLQLQAYLEGL